MCYCRTALVAALLLAATVTSALAAQGANWQVSADSARAAAGRLVEFRASAKLGPFPEWKGAKVGDPTKYVGLDGQVRAYCFPVAKDKTVAGYVMVAASRFHMPLQEFGCSAPPHTRANLEACRRAARDAAGEGKELGVLRFAYLAPGIYAVEFPVLNRGQSVGKVFVDVASSQVIKDIAALPKQEPGVPGAAGASAAWLAVSNTKAASKESVKVQPEFKYIINVPIMRRRTGPDSVAWASVLNYWGIRKPREIPEFIAQQLSESGVGSDSLQGFSRNRGFEVRLATRQRDAAPGGSRASFTDLRMETDAGRPFVVAMTNKSSSGNPVSSTLAGAGYAVDEMGKWVIVHAGTTQAESVAQTDNSAPWCRPGVVFVNWECAVDTLNVTTMEVKRSIEKRTD